MSTGTRVQVPEPTASAIVHCDHQQITGFLRPLYSNLSHEKRGTYLVGPEMNKLVHRGARSSSVYEFPCVFVGV